MLRVSVIVPVLDEEQRIDALLGELVRDCAEAEIVVVDGGSTDATVEKAEAFAGVRVIRAQRGRARQMNAGAAAATGEIFLFLHADTVLPRGAIAEVAHVIENEADFGCFQVHIDSDDVRLRIASRMISTRSRLITSSTGDQAQFYRRDLFRVLGGFPDVPLFEDMMMVERAAPIGRFVCLPSAVRTSARRWLAHGVSRTMVHMLALRTLYHLGVDPHRLARYYATHPRQERAKAGAL